MSSNQPNKDRLGNPFAADVPYARGTHIRGTADDLAKLRHAWSLMRARTSNQEALYNFSGLERRFEIMAGDDTPLDDEIAPALLNDRLTSLGLDHMGGDAERDDVQMFNRQTAAILTSMLVMARPGDTVIGVSPTYSHPCVSRAAARAGAVFVDTVGAGEFKQAMRTAQSRGERVSVVALTRLAVSYQIMTENEIREVVAVAREAGARLLLDDAGGARVGPAVFDQAKSLALGVDIASTGLDKYGTIGPRLGLLAGRKALVAEIRAAAFELGVEARPMLYPAVIHSLTQYDPQRVRELVATTRQVATALRDRFGNRVSETQVTAQLQGEDILELAVERSRSASSGVKPIEATAGLAMILARDHGILTVHLAGIPPGTSALLIKFVPPELLQQFGGAERFAGAIDDAIDTLATVIDNPAALDELLYGADKPA